MLPRNPNPLTPRMTSMLQDVSRPSKRLLSAVETFTRNLPGTAPTFDHFGRLRNLQTSNPTGLFATPYCGNPAKYAKAFLDSDVCKKLFEINKRIKLGAPIVQAMPNEVTLVRFEQYIKASRHKRNVPVRGGYFDIYVDKEGYIFNINSTVRRGCVSRSRSLITPKMAKMIASAAFVAKYEQEPHTVRTRFVYSSHEDRFDPCYEVVISGKVASETLAVQENGAAENADANILTAEAPRGPARSSIVPEQRMFLIHANTGALLHDAARRFFGVPAKAALEIPDINEDFAKQIYNVTIEGLPDKTVLENENLKVYTFDAAGKEVEVRDANGFAYDTEHKFFGAAMTFFWLNEQMNLVRRVTGLKPAFAIKVYVRDPNVQDNAYFDPEAKPHPDVHLGTGSGNRWGGLRVEEERDQSIGCHELGHYVVYWLAPGQDFPGDEGGACHEGFGDLNALLMALYFRMRYAEILGKPFGKQDIIDSTGKIGTYAYPPDGIRNDDNDKTIDDKQGEVHADGEIIAAAMLHSLKALAQRDDLTTEQVLDLFARLLYGATSLVPSHKVTFVDMLNAFLAADQNQNKSANKNLITANFGRHKIKQSKLTEDLTIAA